MRAAIYQYAEMEQSLNDLISVLLQVKNRENACVHIIRNRQQ
jgi:hypothetical protein